MSYASYFGYILPIDDDIFAADNPVSCGMADLLRNNIQHTIDESPQHRINWVDSLTGTLSFSLTDPAKDKRYIWCQTFPHTWLRDDRPTNLDIRLYTFNDADAGGSPVFEVRVRIVPESYPIGDPSAPALVDETYSVSTDAAIQLTADLFTDFDTDGLPAGFSGATCFTDQFLISETDVTPSRIAFMRCEVWMTQTASGTTDVVFAPVGLLVREFV